MVATVCSYFQTSTQLIGYDRLGVVKYGRSFGVVAPIPGPYFFSGVSDKGLNLNYITTAMMAAAAQQTGMQTPTETLFAKAITGISEGPTDGRIFCNSFGQLLSAMPQLPAGAILFSIIDHNSCHHLSVPLVAYAFARANAPAGSIRIVFNVDFHADFGAQSVPGTYNLACGTWGVWTVSTVAGLYVQPLADLYIRIGIPLDPSTNRGVGWRGAVNNTFNAPTPPNDLVLMAPPAQMPPGVTNPNGLLTYLGGLPNWNWNNVYAYVSVDRDFMAESYTPYGDGDYTAAAGRTLVTTLLTSLRSLHAHLVGFDVVGLPATDGWTKTKPTPAPPALLQQALADVQTFQQAVLAY